MIQPSLLQIPLRIPLQILPGKVAEANQVVVERMIRGDTLFAV